MKWIRSVPKRALRGSGAAYWLAKAQGPGYHAWAGNTFEGICLRHAGKLRTALGIEHVPSQMSGWRYRSPKGAAGRGAQVDFLFDRDDGIITICEMKYTDKPFTITKKYALELKRKITIFAEQTRTRKDIQLALVTTRGVKSNIWSEGLVDRVITLADLF
ncbi:MAG TPA: hypothetical protein ENK23_07560 [Sorangium sp.]|nr:hypothetical protein [Sorangium sp.]